MQQRHIEIQNLLRPAIATPVETYNPERTAEFLLSNTTDAADYEVAR